MDNKVNQLIVSMKKISQTSRNIKEFWERSSMHMKISGYKVIGNGDGRIVYRINDDYVLKIAYNAYGKKQNHKENRISEKYGQSIEGQNWLADISYGDDNWILMERLLKCSDDDLLDDLLMEDFKELNRFLFSDGDAVDCPGIRMIRWLVNTVGVDRYEIVAKNFGYDKDGELKMLDYGV